MKKEKNRVILLLLKEVKQVPGLFGLGLLLLVLATAGGQGAPLVMQSIIDGPLRAVAQGQANGGQAFAEQVGLYLVLLLGSGILLYLAQIVLMRCANSIAANLRNRAYDVMQTLPISYFDDKPAGKIATRIVNDTETLRSQFYGTLLSQLFINFLQVLFIYSILFHLSPQVGLMMLVLIPVIIGWQWLYKRMTDKPNKDFYAGRSELNSLVNESMNGMDILQLYHQEKQVYQDFAGTVDKMKAAEYRMTVAGMTVSWSLAELLKYMVIAAVLTMIGMQFLAGQAGVSPGRLFVYISYLMNLFDYLSVLVRQFPTLQRSIATGERLLDLLAENPEKDGTVELDVTGGQVVFEQVGFSYTADKKVLDRIDIRAEKGQTVALVGHTGSGKSSIMNLLYRFYDPQEGRILIDGQDIGTCSRESVRKAMGIVLQDPYLFTGTIASNVTMGKTGYRDEEIVAALEKVGAGPMLARLAEGIQTAVTEKGAAFSSGELQLIAFARTLIANPKILILDEATSHIDTETEEIIQRAMEVLKEGRTTFIIAHRLSTIQHADQILVLEAGKIVERGTHDQLMQLDGRYAQMQEVQKTVGGA